MSIKSDHWIRRQATAGMIEPFEPGQVREIDGRKIVSYGTSSYGYDVRCASEFKIFTNINSTIVDPKAFDPQSFVDVNADVCIIPPNSFALARTVEYFRIPRSTLVVCLGKCVTGDTRVVDADTGAYVPITDMRFGRRTLALDGGRVRPAAVSGFMAQGRKPVFELRTRAGLRIRATANHPFRQSHGWTPLDALQPGDRIAVAQAVPVFGSAPLASWEASLLGLMIAQRQCPAHRQRLMSADPARVALLEASLRDGGLGTLADVARLADPPGNVDGHDGAAQPTRVRQWLQGYGLDVDAAQTFVPQPVFMAPRESVRLFLRALLTGDGSSNAPGANAGLEYCSASRRLVEEVHHLLLRFGVFGALREQQAQVGSTLYSIQVSDPAQLARFALEIGLVPGSFEQLRLESQIPPLAARAVRNADVEAPPVEAAGLLQSVAAAGGTGGNNLGAHALANQPVSLKAMHAVARAAGDDELASHAAAPRWDEVASITPMGEAEVYDISVPRVHNFLANGIVVHNSTYARCGIIVNVTPLEPEWEGHVTLEFSNTTPLPAKIYANEGVAQMLFFESDEVCSTSYKDRAGKYQGQRGVTLPKT